MKSISLCPSLILPFTKSTIYEGLWLNILNEPIAERRHLASYLRLKIDTPSELSNYTRFTVKSRWESLQTVKSIS